MIHWTPEGIRTGIYYGIYVVTITLVVLILYLRTLKYGYTIDDSDVLKQSMAKPKPKNIWQQIYLSFMGAYYKQKELDHGVVILQHLINSLLIYLAFGANWISFLVALLFAIHPVGTQGSIWLSGKHYSRSVTFVLLMYWFKWLTPVFFYYSFIFGSFSSVLAPVIFLFSPFWFWIFLIPVMAWVHRKHIKTQIGAKLSITPTATKKVTLIRSILYFKSLGYYTWLCIFPLRLGVYHNYLYTYGLTEKETKHWHKPDIFALLGLIVIAGLGYCLIYHRQAPYTFGLLWYVALISQWCNFPITIQQSIAERFLYLPLVGFCFFLVHIARLFPVPISGYIYIVFFTGYLIRLLLHITTYRDLYTQIENNLAQFPDCYAAWTWKGQEEKNRGAFFTALEAWFKGWRFRKHDFRLNNNIAVLLTEIGEFDQALGFLKIAEQAIPPDQKEAGQKYIQSVVNNIIGMKRQAELAKRKIILPGGRG